MELKCLLVLTIFGLASGYTVPNPNTDLESSFPSSDTSASPDQGTRDKRHLIKKFKKSHGAAVIVNRQYERGTTIVDRPGREVHHYYHYSQPPPPPPPPTQYVERHVVETRPAPAHDYHHYHGGYSGGYSSTQGATYYKKGYSTGSGYYSNPGYGGYDYVAQPPPPPQGQGPVAAVPVATGYNSVDRGQGAAAVNNIAIIHARAGSSSSTVSGDSQAYSKPLPVDVDAISQEALGHYFHHH